MTKTDNELIAEFMELSKMGEAWTKRVDEYRFDYVGEQLKYQTSWDWLMPVVEKIESMDIRVSIIKNLVQVIEDKPAGYFWNGGITNESKLISTYWAVVEFIKWYNQQNLKG